MTYPNVSKEIYLLTLAKEKFLTSQEEIDRGELIPEKSRFVCIAIDSAHVDAIRKFPKEHWDHAAKNLKQWIQESIAPWRAVDHWLWRKAAIPFREFEKCSQIYRAAWIDQMISLLENP